MELLHVAEINAVTGYIRGGCSPVGMKKLYPTVFHETALDYDTIYISRRKDRRPGGGGPRPSLTCWARPRRTSSQSRDSPEQRRIPISASRPPWMRPCGPPKRDSSLLKGNIHNMQDKIIVKGARENNLKNIDVTIPRDKLVVMTGLSGSGKSSLAFDTIYAEGQRRYVESLSSYARMFLGQMDKPDVDYIEGLSPAISIDQKTTSKNPRSTVGTVTEVYDYLRLLWARVGTPHCPKCGKEIKQQTIDQIIDQVLALPEGTRIQVMAPVIRGKKGEHAKIFEDAKRSGYVRARVDGTSTSWTRRSN